MAWIEAHQKLDNHPKVLDLMNFMGWDLDTALGKLFRFWWWCVDYAEDGNLSKHNDSRLAASVGLNGLQGQEFVEAMVKSGWIDRKPYFRVHDWWEYIGKFLQIKYKHKPEYWKEIQNQYLNGSENGTHNTTKHNITQPTQPNQTKPDLSFILTQNEVLLTSFGSILQEKVVVYLDRVAKSNKTKSITEGRKNTLLNELAGARSLCNNDKLFGEALEATIIRDACCIGYVNKVIKNKKTKSPCYIQNT